MLEQYEDYNGYEIYPADSVDEDEHETQIHVMSIKEESERGITTPQDSNNASIKLCLKIRIPNQSFGQV